MTSAAQAEKVRFCFLFCAVERDVVDSYQSLYGRVITDPSDSDAIKKLPRPLRERIVRNETLHRCLSGWDNPICNELK